MELLRPVKGQYRVVQTRGVDFLFNGKWMYKDKIGWKGHAGIDYAGPNRGDIQEIYSAQKGRVIKATYDDGRGNHIVIRHDDIGHDTIYAHLSKMYKKVGDEVGAGDLIGLSGNTGNVTGVHLHFGLRPIQYTNNGYGGYISPVPYVVSELSMSDYDKDYSSAIKYLVDNNIYSGTGDIDQRRLVIMLARILLHKR